MQNQTFRYQALGLDYDTVYGFRVSALNKTRDGNRDEVVEGETRYGAFCCALETAGSEGSDTKEISYTILRNPK